MQMNNLDTDDHAMNYHTTQDDSNSNIWETINPSQAPQLNPALHGHNCGCELCQNIGEGGDEGGNSTDGFDAGERMFGNTEDYDESNDGDEYLQGDEGVENHHLLVRGHGYVAIRTIFESLARHELCTCHSPGLIPNEYPFFDVDSAVPSGMHSPNSLVVELSSGEHSLESSMYFSRCATPGLPDPCFRFMNPATQVYFFTTVPLPLTQGPSAIGSPYPQTLNLDDDGFVHDDDSNRPGA